MRPLPPPSTLFPYTTLFRSTRSLFLTVNNNVETASALEQTIISRRSALDATRAGYDVGTRNIVEVLDAERAYYVARSEEHTSELQSRPHLVCRLLLEKKKKR